MSPPGDPEMGGQDGVESALTYPRTTDSSQADAVATTKTVERSGEFPFSAFALASHRGRSPMIASVAMTPWTWWRH